MGTGLDMDKVYGEYDEKFDDIKGQIHAIERAVERIGKEKRTCHAPGAMLLYVVVIAVILSDVAVVLALVLR